MKIFIDIGSSTSGVVFTDDNNIPNECFDFYDNDNLVSYIKENVGAISLVVIEGITSQNKNIGKSTIDTIEYGGYIRGICFMLNIPFMKINRFDVKLSLFKHQASDDEEFISYMKEYANKRKMTSNTNELNQAIKKSKSEKEVEYHQEVYLKKSERVLNTMYFALLDDRLISKIVRKYFDIEKPKVGKKNKYGISKHGYQALALLITYKNMKNG